MVDISNLTDIHNLCLICLTKSREMISINNYLDEKLEEKHVYIYQVLNDLMSVNMRKSDEYSLKICGICLGLLRIAYDLKMQFENSQIVISKHFGKNIFKGNNFIVNDNKKEQKKVVPVEIISCKGVFDLKDVLIVEEDKPELNNFDGFLNNLGKEVSAKFINKSRKLKIFESDDDDDNVNNLETERKVQNNKSINIDKDINIIKKIITFECNYCSKTFSSQSNYNLHMVAMHNLKRNKQILCQLCGHLTFSLSGLRHHMASKHKMKRYICDLCGKKYCSSSLLKQHKFVHNNDRPHLCNVCGKRFNYSNALLYHMRLHTGEKKYKCSYCDRQFSMACGLNRHIRTHTGLRPYKCKFCGSAFKSKGEMDCHEMLHTGFRPYHCNICGKGFTKTHNLKVHLLKHKGPHKCDICSKTFVEIEYLKTHMKVSHNCDT